MAGKVWTSEMKCELKTLIHDGFKSSEIARVMSHKFKMNITRNAIVGAAARHMDDETKQRFSLNAPRRGINSNDNKPKRKNIFKKPEINVEIENHDDIFVDGIRFEDLKMNQCKWPITKRSPHRFCGKTRIDGKSYCKEHHAMSIK